MTHDISVYKRVTGFPPGSLVEFNCRAPHHSGKYLGVAVDAIEACVVGSSIVWRAINLEMHLHVGQLDRDVIRIWQ